MSKTPQIKMKSRRQHIRLWFEYYKLCVTDPEHQNTLKKSREFYSPWGDVSSIKFDEWWKTRSYLFGESRVEEISRVSTSPNVINVSIPITQPITQSIEALKLLVGERQKELLDGLKIDPNSVKSRSKSLQSRYAFTPGVEIRGKTEYEILLIYQIWITAGKPPVNTRFCQRVVETLSSRPRSKWIPYQLAISPEKNKNGILEYSDSQIRSVRRYITKGNRILSSVAQGRFPGKHHLK